MADSIVTVENVSLKYKKTVLTNVTINAEKGDVIGLLGLNGSGISTLLSAIAGLRRTSAGTIKVNGKTFKTLTTKNGIAKFKVKQKPGKYKLTLNALGTSLNKTLTVKHLVTLKKVTVKKSAKKLILTAALAKVNKKYLKSKKVTFKFNGKKFTAKTNKKGVAKVTIKPSVLKKLKVGKKVTYQATYLKDTVKKTVKVRK